MKKLMIIAILGISLGISNSANGEELVNIDEAKEDVTNILNYEDTEKVQSGTEDMFDLAERINKRTEELEKYINLAENSGEMLSIQKIFKIFVNGKTAEEVNQTSTTEELKNTVAKSSKNVNVATVATSATTTLDDYDSENAGTYVVSKVIFSIIALIIVLAVIVKIRINKGKYSYSYYN